MSRPNPRPQQAAAMSAAFAGAVDLSALKNRATAAGGPAGAGPGSGAGVAAGAEGAQPQPPSPFVVDVDEATFGSLLQVSSQVLVVIDLWASWADPGKPLSAALSKLAAAAGGSWILGRVDVDANPRIAQAFQVQSLPMVIPIAQGQPITEPLTVPLPEPQVKEWVSALLDALRDHLPGIKEAEARLAAERGDEVEPEPEDPRSVAAEEALAGGDYAAAELAYQQILAVEPANAEATAALAQVGLLARVDKLPPDAIARADAAPEDVELQKNAADALLAAGNAEAAFKRLVDTVRRTSGDERTAAREHLVELFSLFAADDPEVIKARRALAAALY